MVKNVKWEINVKDFYSRPSVNEVGEATKPLLSFARCFSGLKCLRAKMSKM